MDPVANLERQRELAARIIEHNGSYRWQYEDSADGQELAELVQSLDEWRRNGGFDPYAPSVVMNVGEFNEDRIARLRRSMVDAESYYGQLFEEGSH